MEDREKIIREKEVQKHWDDIKKNRNELVTLLLNERDLNQLDIILLFQCISLVLENLELNEERIKEAFDFMAVKNAKENEDKFKSVFEGLAEDLQEVANIKIMEEIEYMLKSMLKIMDQNASINDKFEAIEMLKWSAWKQLFNNKSKIVELFDKYPKDIKEKDFIWITKCISMVIMELDLNEQEAEILEELKFI